MPTNRLPIPNQDSGNWGTLLNSYLNTTLSDTGGINTCDVVYLDDTQVITTNAVILSITNRYTTIPATTTAPITPEIPAKPVDYILNKKTKSIFKLTKSGTTFTLTKETSIDHTFSIVNINSGSIFRWIENTTTPANSDWQVVSVGDVVNVRDWGAVGDGVTDDSTAIQKAIDTAHYSKSIVVFSGGVYNLKTPLKVWSDVRGLRGDGKAELLRGAGAEYASGTTTVTGMNVMIRIYNGKCSLSGLIINGNNQTFIPAVWPDTTTPNQTNYQDIAIDYASPYSYSPDGTTLLPDQKYFQTKDNFVKISDCYFKDAPGSSVVGAGMQSCIIQGCKFDGWYDHAVYAAGRGSKASNILSADIIVDGNIFKHTRYSRQNGGIKARNNVYRYVITNNTFDIAGADAIVNDVGDSNGSRYNESMVISNNSGECRFFYSSGVDIVTEEKVTITGVNIADNTLSFQSISPDNNILYNGAKVKLSFGDGQTAPAPLVQNETYFVISVSYDNIAKTGVIKLATTYVDAIDNIPIDITSEGTNNGTMLLDYYPQTVITNNSIRCSYAFLQLGYSSDSAWKGKLNVSGNSVYLQDVSAAYFLFCKATKSGYDSQISITNNQCYNGNLVFLVDDCVWSGSLVINDNLIQNDNNTSRSLLRIPDIDAENSSIILNNNTISKLSMSIAKFPAVFTFTNNKITNLTDSFLWAFQNQPDEDTISKTVIFENNLISKSTPSPGLGYGSFNLSLNTLFVYSNNKVINCDTAIVMLNNLPSAIMFEHNTFINSSAFVFSENFTTRVETGTLHMTSNKFIKENTGITVATRMLVENRNSKLNCLLESYNVFAVNNYFENVNQGMYSFGDPVTTYAGGNKFYSENNYVINSTFSVNYPVSAKSASLPVINI